MSMMRVEKWIEKKQSKSGFSFIKAGLYVLSVFYETAVRMRHFMYDTGIFSPSHASIPIISVGNIVCGGTGKSEFVIKLLSDLKRDDLSILTRGYRSKRKGPSRLVLDIDDGDEPLMLKKRCPKTAVIVGRKREVSADLAHKMGMKAAILDDGMQYLRLKKDLQIVLVRADEPLGKGFVPLGMRRELLNKLMIADYVVVHGAESLENYELVKRDILCYSRAKCFGTRYCLKKNKLYNGIKVGVFCGVGNPQSFMKGLNEIGLMVVKKKILADHQQFTDVTNFVAECKKLGAEQIVCTEKDYVKFNSREKKLVTPIQISMEIPYDDKVYHTLIEQVNIIIESENSANEG